MKSARRANAAGARRAVRRASAAAAALAFSAAAFAGAADGYLKRNTWQDTLKASIEALRERADGGGLELSEWSWAGPFAAPGVRDLSGILDTPFAPEKASRDLVPAGSEPVRWEKAPTWADGAVHRLGTNEHAAYYLARTLTAPDARRVRVYLGSDDAIAVWLNGSPVLRRRVAHWCAPDQETADLALKAGENRLLIKIANGVLDAAFYFSLRPHATSSASADLPAELWDRLARDFPGAAQEIAWVREDGLFAAHPPERFYRHDDPRVELSGDWSHTIAGGPAGFARRSDRAGDTATVDFVGSRIALLHKEGRLERSLILTRDAEQAYGLASLAIDGRPVEPGGPIRRDADGRSVIDTRRDARLDVARGLAPGRHRLTVANVGRAGQPGGSTAVAVLGFHAGVEDDGPPVARQAWRYALAVRGGAGWQARAAELASKAADEAGLRAVEDLYFASRRADAPVARLRALHDRPPASPMVERERGTWRPQPSTLDHFARLSELRKRIDAALAESDRFRHDAREPAALDGLLAGLRRLADEADACLLDEVRKLPPIVFFTGAPLESGAVPNYVWQSQPLGGRWGCGIRRWDPAHPQRPARVLFEDPKSILFDLALSPDARTLFFSMRRDGGAYWQIYEMGIDGGTPRQLTDGDFYNCCPVPLPDGRLAFLSSRTRGSHTVCQSGPSMHVHVMNRDGSGVRDLSSNTLTDFGLSALADGRLLFTRWEYVDSDLSYRQSLWTLHPDGRQLALYFGNTITDPASFWQAREIPGRGAVVCTMAPHHGSPYGPIGLVTRHFGVEAPRDEGFRWVTAEFPNVEDLNPFWAYRDPCPVDDSRFLVSYGGGGARRFRLFLLDEADNLAPVYDDPSTSCFYPLPVRPRPEPARIPDAAPASAGAVEVPAAPPGQPSAARVATGRYVAADVYRGLEPAVARGRVKSIRIMEQLPKTVNTTWHRAYDQGPLMAGGTTYYAKRCWGYAPVEEDGSAHFEAPAGKELYFQVCDAEGRELQRMTSGTQLMPGEVQGCIGCHESRDSTAAAGRPLRALRRAATPLRWPEWGNAGVVDYVRVVQPVLDRHCVRCHGGPAPAGGVLLDGGPTRFFSSSYDHLVIRSQSAQVSTDLYLGLADDLPLVQFNNMFPGIYSAHRPLTTGSPASRLPAQFGRAHCGSDVSADERRRIFEWIDAMAPYYTTYQSARPGSRGDRDRWSDRDDPKKPAAWYASGFEPVYRRRCEACHGPIHLDARYEWGGKWGWINLGRPEWSPALTAHLAKEAGGRGITEKDFGTLLKPRWSERRSSLIERWSSLQEDRRVMQAALEAGRQVEMFRGTDDPDYRAMLEAIREGASYAAELPEADQPGFVSRSVHLSFGGR